MRRLGVFMAVATLGLLPSGAFAQKLATVTVKVKIGGENKEKPCSYEVIVEHQGVEIFKTSSWGKDEDWENTSAVLPNSFASLHPAPASPFPSRGAGCAGEEMPLTCPPCLPLARSTQQWQKEVPIQPPRAQGLGSAGFGVCQIATPTRPLACADSVRPATIPAARAASPIPDQPVQERITGLLRSKAEHHQADHQRQPRQEGTPGEGQVRRQGAHGSGEQLRRQSPVVGRGRKRSGQRVRVFEGPRRDLGERREKHGRHGARHGAEK
jgi:hypothetical protein